MLRMRPPLGPLSQRAIPSALSNVVPNPIGFPCLSRLETVIIVSVTSSLWGIIIIVIIIWSILTIIITSFLIITSSASSVSSIISSVITSRIIMTGIRITCTFNMSKFTTFVASDLLI